MYRAKGVTTENSTPILAFRRLDRGVNLDVMATFLDTPVKFIFVANSDWVRACPKLMATS